MTGQTIKCQYADLGATVLHHGPPHISHRSHGGGSMEAGGGTGRDGSLAAAAAAHLIAHVTGCSLFSHYD